MSTLTVAVSQTSGARVLHCAGRIDIASTSTLDRAIEAALAETTNLIVLDLAGVDYISSAGLRSVLVVLKKAAVSRKKIAVCGVSPAIMQIFEIAGFASLMKIYPDPEAAVSALSS